jgi:hypothetical protein
MLPELEKISANIVALSASEGAMTLTSQEVAPILPDANVEMAPPPIQQTRLVSLREQVVVQIGGNAFIFSDLSADKPPKARLPEITESFLRLFASKGIQYRGYGFNFEVAFDAPGEGTAAQVLLNRFVKADSVSRKLGSSPVGAGLRLYFEMTNAICNIQIDPRREDLNSPRFYAKANYTYDLTQGSIPPADMLKSDFHGKWATFTDWLDRLLVQ